MTGKSSKSLSAQSRRMTITAPVKSKCANEQAQNRGSRTHVRYSMIHAKTCHSSSKHSIISIRCQVPSVSKQRSSKNIPIFCTCDHLQLFFLSRRLVQMVEVLNHLIKGQSTISVIVANAAQDFGVGRSHTVLLQQTTRTTRKKWRPRWRA